MSNLIRLGLMYSKSNKILVREFSSSPMVRTLCCHCRERGFNAWLGTKNQQAVQHCQNYIHMCIYTCTHTYVFSPFVKNFCSSR